MTTHSNNMVNQVVETRSFKVLDERVFYEIMDYFTVLMMYHDMPKELTVQLEVPKQVLSSSNTSGFLDAYKVCIQYMHDFSLNAEVLQPKQIDGDAIIVYF